MVPLTLAEGGGKSTVVKITGRDEVRQHLAELGFVVGTDVVVTNRLGGNMIVSVKDSRVAIDRDMASRIMVDVG